MENRVFIAQPFSSPYNERFDDVYAPAIRSCGFEAYRVDRDPGVSIPIDDIERNITDSLFVFADITEDNPNVWFEVGYSIARSKELCFVCSDERFKRDRKFPFDIQHRSIITYGQNSKRDWYKLENDIQERINAISEKVEKQGRIESTLKSRALVREEGNLTDIELSGLAVVASALDADRGISSYDFHREMGRRGLNELAANLSLRMLKRKWMITEGTMWDQNESYTTYTLTEDSWRFLEENQSSFVLRKDDEIPF